MAEKPDSDAFLAGIDAKITALQQFRESYLMARAAGLLGAAPPDMSLFTPSVGGGATPSIGQATSGPIDLPTGIFRDKGLADAIRLLMSAAKRKLPFKEIQNALLEGGLATTSASFEQTLSGTLNRMKRSGELLQFKEGWDLAASYPEGFRQRLAQVTEGATAKSKRKKGRKKNAEQKSAPKPAQKAQSEKPVEQPAPVLRAV